MSNCKACASWRVTGYIRAIACSTASGLYAQVDGAIAEDYGRIGQLQRQVLELRLRIRQLAEDFQKDLRSQLAEPAPRTDDLAQSPGLG